MREVYLICIVFFMDLLNRSFKPFRFIIDFIRLESSSGIILFLTAVLALILDNSPFHAVYQKWVYESLTWQIGQWHLQFSTVFVVNDILMTFFFLLVGLEIKREVCIGELNSVRKIGLPGIAALGGMLFPALVYLTFNHGDSVAMRGLAIPTATDIAFALGIIMLLGKRVPIALKLYLMALAIFDDLGAILIIAFFYQTNFSWYAFCGMLVCLSVLIALNRLGVKALMIYGFLGIILWILLLKSGIHPTLAGVLLALAIPLKGKMQKNKSLTRAKLLEDSPLNHLETVLHPWVAYVILPIFSLTNAGVSFAGLKWENLFNPLSLGILLGLFLGKQFGVFATTWIAIRFGILPMPRGASWSSLYAIAMICGVGFTMSLFMGNLAFAGMDVDYIILVKFGVLAGSFLSGVLGYLLLQRVLVRD